MLIYTMFLLETLKKLVPNLFDKEKYVIHFENLRHYLRLGLKLKKIHRMLEFNQWQWLKPYIELNTQTQNQCTGNKQQKRLFKMYIKTKLYVAQNIWQ